MRHLKQLWRGGCLALVALVGACGVAATVEPLSPKAQAVEIAKGDPPQGARLIGPIEASHGNGCGAYGRKGTFEGAMNALREEGARRGADYVELVTSTEPHSETGCFDQEFKLRGMAYKLAATTPASSPAAPTSQPVAAAVSECAPPCSPGYACKDGTCTPQCNPSCAANQTCGPDRICIATPPTAVAAP